MNVSQWAVWLILLAVVPVAATETPSYPGAVPPPPGVTPDLRNPRDAGRIANIAGLVICDAVVTVMFSARTYVKLKYVRKFFLEDLTCTIAWALIILYSATVFMMIRYGEGYHSWEISEENYSQMLKWLYASSIVFNPAAFFTKATLLLLIARVFATRQTASRAIHGFIIFILVSYIPLQSLKIAVCIPIESYWNPNVQGKCFNQRKLFLADLAIGIFTDLVILITPIPLTWRLRVSKWKKFKIVLVLGAGGVATAMSILRLVKVVDFMKSRDVASDFVLLDLLTILEIAIGLICSCMPSINLLLERHLKPHLSLLFCSTKNGVQKKVLKSLSSYLWSLGTTLTRPGGPPTVQADNDSQIQATARPPQETDNYAMGAYTRLVLSSANAEDGMREGWLDLRPGGTSSTEEGGASNIRDISLELAQARGSQPWDRIWDGSEATPGNCQEVRSAV